MNKNEAEKNESTKSPEERAPDRSVSEEKVWESLSTVIDPELHMNITSLGLVYSVDIRRADVDVEMTLTSPGCPYGPQLLYAVEHAVRSVEGVNEVSINVVWEPPWGPDQMSEEARLELGFDV